MFCKKIEYNILDKNFIGDSFMEVEDKYIKWLAPNYELTYKEHYVDENLKHRLKVRIKYKTNWLCG